MGNESKIRKNMVEELIKEVRGPRHGTNETLTYTPFDEYLTGVIIPRSWDDLYNEFQSPKNEIIDQREDIPSEDSGVDEEVVDNFTSNVLGPKSLAKSFGVSFSTEVHNPKFEICATWGDIFL